ncbi:MAG: XRE family transcriptional regulator [Novosphingobium meiothermophilum]|uniref:XRE family transcriptional regulator n=1 Tax=Novosphingobium TaxID=165696 RepID=UPI000D6E26FC|nr:MULTISPECIES: S24 family peptidase [Novosphingobium]
MIVPERLKAAMQLRGLSQSALARAANISSSMVNKLATGHARETAHIYAIAKALKCSPEYLSGEAEAMNADEAGTGPDRRASPAAASFDDLAMEAGLVPVRQIDLAYGMGASYLDMVVEEVTQFFPAGWLRQFTASPASKLFFAQGVGDSMQPTLAPGDVLIIDTSIDRLTMADQIWAITFCGLGMIKRLRPTKDGGVRIMSDNPSVPEEVAYDGELTLIGRVVAVMRKI